MSSQDIISSIGQLLLKQDLFQLIKIVLEGGRYLWKFHQPPGMYEVMDYRARLELHDTKGKKATYFKEQKDHF